LEPKFSTIATVQETNFARQLAIGVSMPDAYVESGLGKDFTRRQCWSRGANLAKTRRIEERVAHFKSMVNRRMDIREDRILVELASIAFSDPRDFVDDDGFPLPIHMLPPHARAAVNIIDTGIKPGGMPYLRLRLSDKLKALQQLVKIKDMEKAHQAHSAPVIEIGIKKDISYDEED